VRRASDQLAAGLMREIASDLVCIHYAHSICWTRRDQAMKLHVFFISSFLITGLLHCIYIT
jgi:hypothetical protein